MEEKSIFSLSELKAQGKKLAKLTANRCIQARIVEAKKKSFKKIGQAIPAVIVNGTTAIQQGLEIQDFETGTPIPHEEASNYVVLLDGNHGYYAHLQLLEEAAKAEEGAKATYTKEFYFMFPLSEDQPIPELLAEINTCTKPWSGADYVVGATTTAKKKLPMLDFINSLTSKGYSLPSASYFATLGQKKLTARDMTKIMRGEDNKNLSNDVNLAAGKKIHKAAQATLGDDFLKARTVPEWLKDKRMESSSDSLIVVDKRLADFFAQITPEQAKALLSIKGKSGSSKEDQIKTMLTDFYAEFENKIKGNTES